MKKTHHICHCQTTLNFEEIHYTWNIVDFWNVYHSLHNLVAYECENLPFNIIVYFDKKNKELRFCSWFNDKQRINVNYCADVEITGEPIGDPIKRIVGICKENIYLSHDEFLYRASIEKLREQESLYLPNGTLTISFQFEVLENIFHNTISENVVEDLRVLNIDTLVSNEESDSLVKFVIDKKYLYINKDLLCSKSTVFEAMFNSEMEENKNNEIKISDIKFDVFNHLLLYVESGSLTDLENCTETLYDLIVAADKYNIKDLLLSCEKLLILNTSKDNVVKHLRVAHLNNAQSLEKYAIKFIKLYENNIVGTSSFRTLILTYPKLLIKIKEEKLNSLQMTHIT